MSTPSTLIYTLHDLMSSCVCCFVSQDLHSGTAAGISAVLQHLCLCVWLGPPDAPHLLQGLEHLVA
jgi:hypothetical protein